MNKEKQFEQFILFILICCAIVGITIGQLTLMGLK